MSFDGCRRYGAQEGTELGVLEGSRELLAACRPTLLIEIKSVQRLADVEKLLAPYDYRSKQPDGFMSWNYLFVAGSRSCTP